MFEYFTIVRILCQVQKALSEDEEKKTTVFNTLKSGDWVTPDLQQSIASSAVMTRSLQNPKCVAALQLMQSNPKEAERRFKGDPEIDEFMKEFGRIMGAHFTSLGEKQTTSDTEIPAAQTGPVQELGPLHAKAISKSKTSVETSSSGSSSTTDSSADNNDDERVKEVRTLPMIFLSSAIIK